MIRVGRLFKLLELGIKLGQGLDLIHLRGRIRSMRRIVVRHRIKSYKLDSEIIHLK